MHQATLSEDFRSALKARRGGKESLFAKLEPGSTALLVIDMQNVFVDPASPLAVPAAKGIVPNINRLATTMRASGCRIVWVRSTFTDSGRGSWPLYFEQIAPAGSGKELRSLFHPDAEMHGFCPGLARDADDTVVDKDRFSVFAAGASDLESTLRKSDIDSIVISGTLTNVCCESAMRDAMMRDFRCVLVADATAAQSDREHVAALENAARYFGDVADTVDVLDRLKAVSA